jgi:polysaccharide deacetylase family protein (PEP-CTERM system associated)
VYTLTSDVACCLHTRGGTRAQPEWVLIDSGGHARGWSGSRDAGDGVGARPRCCLCSSFQDREAHYQLRTVVNAFTVDFEDWYQGLEIPHTAWDGYEDRIVPATRRLLALLAHADVRATFFILGYAAERDPELVREIASGGHEIATHGHSHAFVYDQTPEVFRAELMRSVQTLEKITGDPVLGHRAAFFSITKKSLWALDFLPEVGIRYDSSIFPVWNYRYGIHDAPRWPHVMNVGGRTLIEFPISTWSLAGRNLPVGGGAYFRIFPYAYTRHAFRAINAGGRPAVFYIHPWEIDPHHPRTPLPQRIARIHYLNLGATERRLRRLLQDFRFAPMKEVLRLGLNTASGSEVTTA